MSLVSRVLMIFQACGAKLDVEATAARPPTNVATSKPISMGQLSLRKLRAVEPWQERSGTASDECADGAAVASVPGFSVCRPANSAQRRYPPWTGYPASA